MSAGLERRVQKLEEEFERAFARPVRIRLYWVDPETGESTPAWSDEEEARYQRMDEEKWARDEARGDFGRGWVGVRDDQSATREAPLAKKDIPSVSNDARNARFSIGFE